jgi:hypothetical protein
LLALIVTTAQTGATLAAYRINLIDKDDAGEFFLACSNISRTRAGADADKHFHKIRAGDAEERHFGFTRNGFGQQGFTGTGAAGQQNAARHTAAQTLVAVEGAFR